MEKSQSSWPKVRQRGGSWQVDLRAVGEGRKNFKTKGAAEVIANRYRSEAEKHGLQAFALPPVARAEASRALEILGGEAGLDEAADFYLRHKQRIVSSKTVREVKDEYIAAKTAANRRPRTIETLLHRFGKLVVTFGDYLISELSTANLEDWLNLKKIHGISRTTMRADLVGLFNFALRRGYALDNPAKGLEKPMADDRVPKILTVDESRRLLAKAVEIAPKMIPYFVLGMFAGLRPAELQRLEWKAVRLEEGFVRVIPEVAKKRRMRLVQLSENAVEWLAAYRSTGPIHFERMRFDEIREAAGVTWAQDILRHSFGSYALAANENGALTAMQMGNSQDVLFRHYRELVTKKEAEKFWAIRPTGDVIQIGKAG